MLEIKVTIECPDLVLAATAMAKALHGIAETANSTATASTSALHAVTESSQSVKQATEPTVTAEPVNTPQSATTAPTEAHIAPVAPPMPAGVVPPAQPPMPAAAPAPMAPVVPTAAAPQITPMQIADAGAKLLTLHPELLPKLNEMLPRYGVNNAMELRPEQIGQFAAELRAMGANI